MTTDTVSPYSFIGECDSCGAKPVYANSGMCAVCTHGTADAMWDWLDYKYKGKELKRARKYVINLLDEVKLFNKKTLEVDLMVASIMHIDQEILDKIEELI